MGAKVEMISGDAVPSWVRSIPGPKYSIETDKFKKRAPSWAFRPVGDGKKKEELSASASAPAIPTTDQLDPGIRATRKMPPKWSLGTKPEMVIGGNIPSWTNSIPGPKYTYDTDKFKNRQPCYHIGEKLKTEGEIMSTRSPGPIYGGSAIDAKQQSKIDSTKRKSFEPTFGVGDRFKGRTYDIILSGAYDRYE